MGTRAQCSVVWLSSALPPGGALASTKYWLNSRKRACQNCGGSAPATSGARPLHHADLQEGAQVRELERQRAQAAGATLSSDAAAVLDERTTVCASDAGSAASSSRPLNFLRSPSSLDADSESA